MALKNPLRESLKLLDDFGKMSGLKLNCGKTEALWIGSKTNCNLRLCSEKTSNGRLRDNCFSKITKKNWRKCERSWGVGNSADLVCWGKSWS